ncbi:MAG: N-acetylmuramoyl-L-alanine amidase [Flavobacteriales bacterium]|nr:N-acetylmuramoyl-L-alanine amidase [Flavobacteriales bacterium]
MKEIQGQFILMDKTEFAKWLQNEKVSRKVVRIQNHHTWRPDYSTFKGDNHFKLLKGMKNSHLKRGFSDIAQNITTFPDGTIAICRPMNKIPAGIKGANTGGICIEHVGNFDEGGDKMTAKHKSTILRMNALLCQKFSLKPNDKSLVYHHWYDLSTGKRKNGKGSTKSCPGTNFFGGNTVEAAKENFIPKVAEELAKLKPASVLAAEEKSLNDFAVRYSKKGVIEHGKELQKFLNKFPGIKVKVDGWPGKKSSDAFKKITGYYLKGDPRIK